ncbi:c-type cytochrome [Sphingomonas flavalba]|uniref:c-type cytochrome n=1 Tax=Sphingomonas flavalba TaxID=2559804 RepID=UPI00109E13F4|nr:cytochrome c family protein [Sphingomonas flavalba]
MDNRTNTIAGWVLGAAIVALGAGIVSSEFFRAERPEKMGYPIEGVVEDGDGGGAAAAVPIEALLASADLSAGEKAFAKCAACHSVQKGGANGIGPDLWGVVGDHIAEGRGGFAFSSALKAKGGTWTFQALDEWLTSPRKYAEGTKMTFAGIGKAEERANLIAWLNQQSDSPQPLPAVPAAPAEEAPAAEGAADAAAPADNAAAPADAAPAAETPAAAAQ